PTISIEQKTTGTNPRSTVGTITEIADYLRVLFARVGKQHCHNCGEAVQGQSPEQIALEINRLPTKNRLWLMCPLIINRKGEHRDVLALAREEGFVRLRIDGKIVRSEELESLDKKRKHTIEAVADRIVIGEASLQRLTESVEQTLRRGKGTLVLWNETAGTERIYSEHLACDRCGLSFPELTP